MPSLEEAREQAWREDKWTTARRVVSNDHPSDCPCIRDHLEVSFIHGMGVAEERIAALVAAARAAVAEFERRGRDADWVTLTADLKSALAGQTARDEVPE